MAMRILASRLVSPMSVPVRATCGSSTNSIASMSSSTTPSSPRSNVPANEKQVKKESLKSIIDSLIGKSYQPADSREGPLPAAKVNLPDITEHATGEAKLLLLAFENGFLDPYCNMPLEREGRGTRDNPVKIESFLDERMVGCICETPQNHVKWTYVFKGEPKRCQCGHWMELVSAPKFWEKIPKEDLVGIPYFQELEQEGKLDKLLAGEEVIDSYGNKAPFGLH